MRSSWSVSGERGRINGKSESGCLFFRREDARPEIKASRLSCWGGKKKQHPITSREKDETAGRARVPKGKGTGRETTSGGDSGGIGDSST